MYYRYRAGYKKFLIDLNIDVCAYHKNETDSAVMNLIRDTFVKFSTNVLQPCPIKGNLSIKALPLTAALVNNLFVPAGEYKLVIDTKVNKNKEFGINLAFYVKVPAGRTIEDDRMG